MALPSIKAACRSIFNRPSQESARHQASRHAGSKRANQEDADTDSDMATDKESMTPSTTASSDTEEVLPVISDEPQLGPGLYHDEVENLTPVQPFSPPVEVESRKRSESLDRSSTTSTSLPSQLQFTREETLFVFDWDDTILPSSWVQSQGLRLDEGSAVSEAQRRQLAEVEPFVCETLRLAKMSGTVVLVTNAERGWIELSCRKFMPSVASLLENLRMVSARTSYESSRAPTPVDWKVCAFETEIVRNFGLPKLHDASYRKNVFSLGDGVHEREALLRTASCLPNCRAKSLKFAERPDLAQIIKQHALIAGCFESILNHDTHLDLCIRCN